MREDNNKQGNKATIYINQYNKYHSTIVYEGKYQYFF